MPSCKLRSSYRDHPLGWSHGIYIPLRRQSRAPRRGQKLQGEHELCKLPLVPPFCQFIQRVQTTAKGFEQSRVLPVIPKSQSFSRVQYSPFLWLGEICSTSRGLAGENGSKACMLHVYGGCILADCYPIGYYPDIVPFLSKKPKENMPLSTGGKGPRTKGTAGGK
jgi:hypothetical protein